LNWQICNAASTHEISLTENLFIKVRLHHWFRIDNDDTVLDFNGVAWQRDHAFDEIIMLDCSVACGHTIKDHNIASMYSVQPVTQFVNEHTVIAKKRCFHGRATDVELLKHIHTHKECSPESQHNY
jgi:hypothetical protein